MSLTASQTALLNLLSQRRLLFVDQQGVWTLGSGGRIDSGTPDTLRRKNFIKNVGTTKGVSRYDITEAGKNALEASK